MSLPEPLEPERNPTPPPPSGERADWLCGPDEGLEAEIARKERENTDRPRPTLLRPGRLPGDAAAAGSPVERPSPLDAPASPTAPTLLRPAAPEAPATTAERKRPGSVDPGSGASDFTTGTSMIWEPGANSVPALRSVPKRVSAPMTPIGRHEFPMDDAEERALARAQAMTAAAAAAEIEGRPHEMTTPDAFDVTVVPMPWWMQAPYVLRNDRRLQLLVACAGLALAAIAFWPRGDRPLSLREIGRNPDHFNGQTVHVAGRVGEVFPVGGGFAFYLHQGGDTLVVFTRTRTPRRGDKLKLQGMMSTGVLDGQPHSALFESAASE